MNVYDVRLYDKLGYCGVNWPSDLPEITSYLRVSLQDHYDLHCSQFTSARTSFVPFMQMINRSLGLNAVDASVESCATGIHHLRSQFSLD